MMAPVELRHVRSGPQPGERSSGFALIEVAATATDDGADRLLDRARTVLGAVLAVDDRAWPELARWAEILPQWFVDACAPEQTDEQAQRWLAWWRSLPPDEQSRASRERRWTLSGWLYWLEPEQRQWYWWDGVVADAGTVRVTAEVDDWPSAVESLEWLLRACGATDVSVAEV